MKIYDFYPSCVRRTWIISSRGGRFPEEVSLWRMGKLRQGTGTERLGIGWDQSNLLVYEVQSLWCYITLGSVYLMCARGVDMNSGKFLGLLSFWNYRKRKGPMWKENGYMQQNWGWYRGKSINEREGKRDQRNESHYWDPNDGCLPLLRLILHVPLRPRH